MVIFCSWPVPRSLALTSIMPFASMSKVTSIWGTPLGDGGMPIRWNRPRLTLSTAIGLSPWSTWISTLVWPSAAVEKTSLLRVGIVVFLSISLWKTLPRVSTPRDRGVTSSSRISFTVPSMTPPWMAAPIATHSMGSTPRSIFFPMTSSTNRWTMGILVGPPTRMILSIWSGLSLASPNACFIGSLHRSTVGLTRSSSFALVSFMARCLGPEASAVRYGRFTSVSIVEDNSILAFSAASLIRCVAILSFETSMLCSALNSLTMLSTNALSMSVPPSCVSPLVDTTSNTPSPKSIIVTSRVPPPRSKTIIFWSFSDLSRPYASAAAVGSLIILTTSSPAIAPASFVACLWLSLK